MTTPKEKQIVHDWSSGSLNVYEIEAEQRPISNPSSGDEYVGQPIEDPLDQ
jgi:hypothetical protein